MTDRLTRDPYAQCAALFLALLLVLRVGALIVSPLELYADESQYWRWGQTLDWGYYSKPPLIAWVIHGATAIFGDSEWAVRLASPFLHTIAAVCLFLLGRAIFSSLAGLMAAIAYAVMPGVILSATLISTDGVLLPIWSLALLLYWRLRERAAGWIGAIGFGLALGTGFLAKYAMLYFVIGLALTALLDASSRRALFSVKGAVAGLIALVVVAPHFAWNAANEFQTLGHTLDNANLGGPLLNPDHAVKFFSDQMGVFGPIPFLALIAGIFLMRRTRGVERAVLARENWLICFILPVLVIILFQAVLSRAHANWAATAYPAASVLVPALLLRARRNRALWYWTSALTLVAIAVAPGISWQSRIALAILLGGAILAAGLVSKFRPVGLFWAGMALQVAIGVIMACLLAAPQTWTSALGLDNALKRARGWDELTTKLANAADEVAPSAILFDEREIWHGVDYYQQGRIEAPLIAWRYNEGIKSFSETRPLTGDLDDRVLVASDRPDRRARIRADFAEFEYYATIGVDLGTRSNGCPIRRELVLYVASGFDPLPRTEDWVERFDGQKLRAPAPCPAE